MWFVFVKNTIYTFPWGKVAFAKQMTDEGHLATALCVLLLKSR